MCKYCLMYFPKHWHSPHNHSTITHKNINTNFPISGEPVESQASLICPKFFFFFFATPAAYLHQLMATSSSTASQATARGFFTPVPQRGLLKHPFFLCCFLGPHLWHMDMDVPRLAAESKLQPPTYATAIAIQMPSCVFELHHSLPQRRILNPLREARDRTRIFVDTSWARYCWATTGTSLKHLFFSFFF